MGDIITLFPQEELANQTVIDIRKVEEGNVRRQLDPSLIQAATEETAFLASLYFLERSDLYRKRPYLQDG